MKHDVNAFGYRVWTKAMPRMNRFYRSSDPGRLEAVANGRGRELVRTTPRVFVGSNRGVLESMPSDSHTVETFRTPWVLVLGIRYCHTKAKGEYL